MLTCSNAYRHVDTHVHMHSYTCTQTRTCTCLHRDTYVCACTCMDAHETHVHMCTDTYVHAHTYTYTFRGNSWLPTTDLKTQLQETIKCYLYISVFSFQIQTAPTGAIAGTYFTPYKHPRGLYSFQTKSSRAEKMREAGGWHWAETSLWEALVHLLRCSVRSGSPGPGPSHPRV